MKSAFTSVRSFISNIISGNSDTSHKRIIAILSFLVLIAMVVVKAKGGQVDSNLIYVFAALTGGQSALSVIEKFKK